MTARVKGFNAKNLLCFSKQMSNLCTFLYFFFFFCTVKYESCSFVNLTGFPHFSSFFFLAQTLLQVGKVCCDCHRCNSPGRNESGKVANADRCCAAYRILITLVQPTTTPPPPTPLWSSSLSSRPRPTNTVNSMTIHNEFELTAASSWWLPVRACNCIWPRAHERALNHRHHPLHSTATQRRYPMQKPGATTACTCESVFSATTVRCVLRHRYTYRWLLGQVSVIWVQREQDLLPLRKKIQLWEWTLKFLKCLFASQGLILELFLFDWTLLLHIVRIPKHSSREMYQSIWQRIA